ncbi:N-acetylmuramoyl-L-alanine amidase [Aquipuribacter nitratireducens]|uniref:N-acetylmuramoyl-L-alanine amidase n=1 Tax=Aquipuribacter nitratireducens TaxID=650104 RepID=A0ABW0GK95_9MICO
MTHLRRAAALVTATATVGGLLVFDVVSLPQQGVAPRVTTLALASEVETLPPGTSPGVDAVGGTGTVTTHPVPTDDFTLVGLTWDEGDAPGRVEVRVREADGWSAWTPLDPVDGGPDPGTEEAALAAGVTGTEPLVTDGADAFQVRVAGTGPDLPESLTAAVVDPGESPADGSEVTGTPLSGAEADLLRPRIVPRSAWGADESLRRCSPSYSAGIEAATVHHTAGTNGYSRAASAGIVRGIYAYHTQSLGWCDVGYNFLVDRFGTVYEGRAGGIASAVRGAHAGGFNDRTFGVSAIGNYETAAAPEAMVRAIGQVIGWKLSLFGRSAAGTTALTSAGGSTSRYPSGQRVTLPRVFAHRDVGMTACPGRTLVAALGAVRAEAGRYGGALASSTRLLPVQADGDSGSELLTYDPVTGAQRLVDVGTDGRSAPLSSTTWSTGWTHLVPVEADGSPGQELLLYDRAGGRQALLDLAGGKVRTLSSVTWSRSWTHVVPVESDGSGGSELVVYNAASGRQQLLDLAGGRARTVSKVDWSRSWSQVTALEADGSGGSEVLVYNAASGRQQLLDLVAGRARTLTKADWSPAWSHVVPVEADGSAGSELVLYNRASGRQAVIDTRGGGVRTMSTSAWSRGWTEVLAVELDRSVRSEVLVFQAATRRAVYLDMAVNGSTRTLAQP